MDRHDTEQRDSCRDCGVRPAAPGSCFCLLCREWQLRRIGGWLWLPLVNLILTIVVGIYNLHDDYLHFMHYGRAMPPDKLNGLTLHMVIAAVITVLAALTLMLFLKRSRYLPGLFIAFVLTAIIAEAAQVLSAVFLMDIPADTDLILPLVRLTITGVLWIAYFRISVRVQKTFVY